MTPDVPDVPPPGGATFLAERFAADALALRQRAEQLESARPTGGARGAKGGAKAARAPIGGPDAAACRRMADACDRVHALFAGAADGAADGAALGALLPILERVHADEKSPDARHVYAGALARLRQTLGDADDDFDDDDDDEDDDEP
jgi:hypothetical protein